MNINIEDLDVAEERKVFIPSPSGKMVETNNYKAIWNLNSNSLGCIASNGYNIIQHKKVAESVIEALKNLNLKYDSKIRIDEHRIFIDITFPETKLFIKEINEEFIGGVRLINSYDKTTGLVILPKIQRLICNNGMIVDKFIIGYSIRHNQRLAEDFQGIIEKTLNNMINSCDILKAIINECLKDSIEWSYTKTLLNSFIKTKKHIEGIMGNLEKKEKITRWDLYNSITSYCTHGEQLKPNVEIWLQNRAQKLLQTKFEEFEIEVVV